MTREDRLIKDGVTDPVLFYSPKDANGCGSNFSKHGVKLLHPFTGELALYATGEHRYQAMKATHYLAHELIRTAASPSLAKKFGGTTDLRFGWGNNYGDLCWYVMMEVITAKTLQHSMVRNWLKQTGSRAIYEDSVTDDIWGWRYHQSYTGKNLLGRCWMQVRTDMQLSD
jgi:ribA/ribD-fused uncharacterized protein